MPRTAAPSAEAAVFIRPANADDAPSLEGFLAESTHLYPGILDWFRAKVAPALDSARRAVLVATRADAVVGAFIGKPGRRAKICTLRLADRFRCRGLGKALVHEGVRHLAQSATRDVHVTVSEAAEKTCQAFFEGLGFRHIATERERYVRGVDEYVYSCPAVELKQHLNQLVFPQIRKQLFGATFVPGVVRKPQALLISLRPNFAKMIMEGKKIVEFRRKFSERHQNASAVFYVTHPVRRFLFSAVISKVQRASVERLWIDHAKDGGIQRDEFRDYFRGVSTGFALRLDRVKLLPNSPSLAWAKSKVHAFRPPQSFMVMDGESPLLDSLGISRGDDREP
ncbi:MAG TPA: GNAT family N-acetyltransferase [Phycisphaerae bacterium]|nr:GNAT family N-acetyltransferase [Phycisphaerae bacterium]